MSASEAYAEALRLLTGRDRSERDLAARLRRKGFDAAAIETALARCRELGYLDDARFARQRAQALTRSGRAVGARLRAELKRQGLDNAEAEEAAAEACRQIDPAQLLRELLERRFPGFSFASATDREQRRVVNFFQRRGFALSTILNILKQER